jgi:hypothetical protein
VHAAQPLRGWTLVEPIVNTGHRTDTTSAERDPRRPTDVITRLALSQTSGTTSKKTDVISNVYHSGRVHPTPRTRGNPPQEDPIVLRTKPVYSN